MSQHKMLTPGHTVIYPNREKAASKVMKLIVIVILLISVGLMLIVTIGGWNKLQGLKAVNLVWCLLYLIMAFYIARWNRGLLPMAAALGILLLMICLIAGTGASGTSWFDRHSFGYAAPQTIFGSRGLDPQILGAVTLILAPVQVLLIFFAMRSFAQGWNVELEVPIEEARRRGYNPPREDSRPPQPAAA